MSQPSNIEFPKNRRKTYRYFASFDILEFKGEYFVRFPYERRHFWMSAEQAKQFLFIVSGEANLQRWTKRENRYDPLPGILPIAVETARHLLNLPQPSSQCT